MNQLLLNALMVCGVLLLLSLTAMVALIAATVGWRLGAALVTQLKIDRKGRQDARRAAVGQVVD